MNAFKETRAQKKIIPMRSFWNPGPRWVPHIWSVQPSTKPVEPSCPFLPKPVSYSQTERESAWNRTGLGGPGSAGSGLAGNHPELKEKCCWWGVSSESFGRFPDVRGASFQGAPTANSEHSGAAALAHPCPASCTGPSVGDFCKSMTSRRMHSMRARAL